MWNKMYVRYQKCKVWLWHNQNQEKLRFLSSFRWRSPLQKSVRLFWKLQVEEGATSCFAATEWAITDSGRTAVQFRVVNCDTGRYTRGYAGQWKAFATCNVRPKPNLNASQCRPNEDAGQRSASWSILHPKLLRLNRRRVSACKWDQALSRVFAIS